MTKNELLDVARSLDIQIDSKANKQTILDKINESE